MSQRDVVRIFETLTRTQFQLQNVENAALEAQYNQTEDSVARTFAALMLLCGARSEFAIAPGAEWVQNPLTTASQFAKRVVSA